MIENNQNLIVEGCYIPFDWKKGFEDAYLDHIRCRWLIMSENYIRKNFGAIREHACDIEDRLDDSGLNAEELIRENLRNLEQCRKYGCDYIYIDGEYPEEI